MRSVLAAAFVLVGVPGCVHPDPGPPRASFSAAFDIAAGESEGCSFSMCVRGGSNSSLRLIGHFYVDITAEVTPPGDATLCTDGWAGSSPLPNCGVMSAGEPEGEFLTAVRLDGDGTACRHDVPLTAFAFGGDRAVVRADVEVVAPEGEGEVEIETNCLPGTEP